MIEVEIKNHSYGCTVCSANSVLQKLVYFQTDCTELSSMSWYRSVALYGHNRSTSSFDSSDPDNELIPMIVEKVLVPKLTGMTLLVSMDPYMARNEITTWAKYGLPL